MPFRIAPLVTFVTFVTSLIGCASSDPAPEGTAGAAGPDASETRPAPACTSPRLGLYLVDVKPTTSCPWWDSTRDRADMNILEDAVGYPHSDDVCGEVEWNGCSLRDECGPIKISAGSTGWYGKGSLSVTFTDDEHFAGTVTYDIGHECVMILDVRGRHLALGG